jgi:molybdate transport system regulatory protein
MPRAKAAAPSPTSPKGGRSHTLSIRIDLAGGTRIGPGKIALLEAIAREGSISAAGRALRMSYRRAWELVEDLNRGLGSPVVTTSAGGSGGGGASLTAVGNAVVDHYRAIEAEAAEAAKRHVAALGRFVATTPPE